MDAAVSRPAPKTLPEGRGDHASTARRVTQRDVARVAGVHASTVSSALRGRSNIAATTRDRVRQLAASMGFAPDPVMQALVAYRNRISGRLGGEAIAFVTNDPSKSMSSGAQSCFAGAKARAAELGFTLDHFCAGVSGRSLWRLSQILYHRGITGVILHPDSQAPRDWRALEWERLSVVAIGSHISVPAVHRVAANHLGNVRMAIRRALEAGYQRVGMAVADECDGACMLALASNLHAAAGRGVAPFFTFRTTRAGKSGSQESFGVEAERLRRWIRIYCPDVILGMSKRILPYLELLGVDVPGEVALFDMEREESDPCFPGVNQNPRAIGAVAAGLVIQQLRKNAHGIPVIATRTLVDGVWCGEAAMPRERARTVRRGDAGDVSPRVEAAIAQAPAQLVGPRGARACDFVLR